MAQDHYGSMAQEQRHSATNVQGISINLHSDNIKMIGKYAVAEWKFPDGHFNTNHQLRQVWYKVKDINIIMSDEGEEWSWAKTQEMLDRVGSTTLVVSADIAYRGWGTYSATNIAIDLDDVVHEMNVFFGSISCPGPGTI